MAEIKEPSKQQLALVAFAESYEATGVKPSHYYRLTIQILEARAVVNDWKAKNETDLHSTT